MMRALQLGGLGGGGGGGGGGWGGGGCNTNAITPYFGIYRF